MMSENNQLVMFVDDDSDFLYLLQRIAKKIPAISHSLTASNGKDAIKQIQALLAEQAGLPSLVFVDVNMPVMDGFEFLNAIKALADQHPVLLKTAHIVMLSSSIDTRDKERAFATGIVTNYLFKQPGSLMKADIERLLNET